MHRLPFFVSVFAVLTWLPATCAHAAPETAWRMARHDPHRTNFSPGTAHLATPAIRWRVPFDAGATVITDVDADQDGDHDLVIVSGGRLTARRLTGGVLWKTAVLGVSGAIRTDDLTGDGVPEVLALSSRAAYLVHANTGAVQWSSPHGVFKSLYAVIRADFTGDGHTDLALADVGSPFGTTVPTTYVYSFFGGPAQQVVMTAIPTASGQFANAITLNPGDVDGDGFADILNMEAGHLAALSGKTGAMLGTTDKAVSLSPFPSAVATVPAGGGKAPYLLWSGDTPHMGSLQTQVGVRVLQLQSGKLAELWAVQAASLLEESWRTVPAAIGDLDGDGMPEVIASHFVAGAWRLEAYDLATGQLLTAAGIGGDAPAAGVAGPTLRGGFLLNQQRVLVCALQIGRQDPVVTPLKLVTWQRSKGFAALTDLGVGNWWPANLQRALTSDALWKVLAQPLLGLSSGAPAPEVLVRRDTDDDARFDTLDRLTIAASGTVVLTASLKLDPGTGLLSVLPGGKGLRVVGARTDGSVPAWNSALALVNDADGNGVPDLQQRVGGHVALSIDARTTGGQPIIAVNSGSRVALLDPFGAGPAAPPKVLWSLSPSGQINRANLADTDGDGAPEVAVRLQTGTGKALITGYAQTGASLWAWQWPDSAVRWSLTWGDPWWSADLDGDGAEELYLSTISTTAAVPDQRLITVLTGKSHLPLWSPQAACGKASDAAIALDTASKPPRVVMSGYYTRTLCDALTGAVSLTKSGLPGSHGVPMLADLDGVAPHDIVLGGPGVSLEAETGQALQPLWSVADPRVFDAPAALPLVQGQHLYVQLVPTNSEIDVRVAATGKLLWSKVYLKGQALAVDKAPKHSITAAGLVTLADLTGDKQPAALFTTSEGLLYAVALSDGGVLWTLDVGGIPGNPVPADIDGDGLLEIVLATPDGDLIALDSNVATPPDWVREHGSAGLALDDSADIDQQEDAQAVAANWAPVANAQGYGVRLLDDSGAELVPAQVTTATDMVMGGLYLQLGRTYYAVVASHASKGPDATFSTETKSDGVQIVDLSPPWLTDLRCDPSCIAPLGTALAVTGVAHDKTRLASVRATLVQAGSPAGQRDWQELVAELPLQWQLPALPLGQHSVAWQAVDLAGHPTQASLNVTVCAPTGVAGAPQCADLNGVSGSDNDLYGKQVDGCGAAVGLGGGWVVALVTLFLSAMAVLGRRSVRSGPQRV